MATLGSTNHRQTEACSCGVPDCNAHASRLHLTTCSERRGANSKNGPCFTPTELRPTTSARCLRCASTARRTYVRSSVRGRALSNQFSPELVGVCVTQHLPATGAAQNGESVFPSGQTKCPSACADESREHQQLWRVRSQVRWRNLRPAGDVSTELVAHT